MQRREQVNTQAQKKCQRGLSGERLSGEGCVGLAGEERGHRTVAACRLCYCHVQRRDSSVLEVLKYHVSPMTNTKCISLPNKNFYFKNFSPPLHRLLESTCKESGVTKCCRVLLLQLKWEQGKLTLTTQLLFTLPPQKNWSHFVENPETRMAGSWTSRPEMNQIATFTYCSCFTYSFIVIRIFRQWKFSVK